MLTIDQSSKPPGSEPGKIDLVDAIGEFFYDPLGFVYFAYPWGEKGSLLENEEPDAWQKDFLRSIGKQSGDPAKSIQEAVASGHGIGKTALTAWIIHWFISTRPDPQILATANTETQLNSKTWRELAKWHQLSVHRDWFQWTATRFYHKSYPETWFASAIPWNAARPEAFAGTHERYVLLIFDESSSIEDIIWETADGAMTTPGAIWLVFGNPTRNTGRFKDCFGKFRHRWNTRHIDSRNARKADGPKIKEWLDDYGEDSDFFKIRVRGIFPSSASTQFIGEDIVDACVKYQAEGYQGFPKILGVDVARFGDDQTVFILRQGRKVFPPLKFRGLDTMQTAGRVADLIIEQAPQVVMIDGVGVGGGVIDRLRQLGYGSTVMDVNAGGEPIHKDKYRNKRSEMWGLMREYLKAGAELPEDQDLRTDLLGPEYGFTAKQQIALERKEDMKRRGVASPDCGDSLALTFAGGVVRMDPGAKSMRRLQLGVV